MKRKFLIIMSCAMLLGVAGCNDKKNEPASIIGNTEKPVWVSPSNYDMAASMTAVVKIDLTSTYSAEQLSAAAYKQSADDVMAAFAEDSCLGVGIYKEDYGMYWLYITAPESGKAVTLKYYSAALKNIFVSGSFPFSNDTQLGLVSQPYIPTWTVSK